MLQTVEMRWFCLSACPVDLESPAFRQCEVQTRSDWYALPCSPRSGVKLREGCLEVKLLVEELGDRHWGRWHGHLEAFEKWSVPLPDNQGPSTDALQFAGWLEVAKTRRLQRWQLNQDTPIRSPVRPEDGCEFEVTQLCVRGELWWTVGFEAIGTQRSAESNLAVVANYLATLGGWRASLELSQSLGYAAWLARFTP